MEVVNVEKYLVNLAGNICELLIILFFFKGRYKLRVPKTIFIPACILLVGFQFANTNLFLSKSTFIILGSFIFVFLATLLYRIKWIHRIIFLIFLYLIIALSEAIVGIILTMLFKVDISYIQNDVIIFATSTLASKFLAYFFVLILRNIRFNKELVVIKQNFFLIFSLPIASVLVMLLFLNCCYQIEDYSFFVITLITSIALVFANITVFYTIDKLNDSLETKEKLAFAEKQINNQVVHYQELYNNQSELKMFRHNIKHELLSLISLIKENQISKALETMEKNVDWLDEMNNNIVNSGNPVLDAILQSKLHVAKEKGISVNSIIKFSTNIYIDEVELGTVLGNALDNAIEAVEKISNNKIKTIEFKLISTNERISISIKNPVKEKVDVENINTTKEDKKNHGYGIKSMKTIVEQYDGFLSISSDDNYFLLNINMANCPKS